MKLVISIVSWNTCDLLRRCLASLTVRCRAHHVRIIVIDNGSTDGTLEMLRGEFPAVCTVDLGRNVGFANGHNQIANFSSEPFVLFLNPDTEFTEDTHEHMLAVFEKYPDVALVGCKMVDVDGVVQSLGCQMRCSPFSELLVGIMDSRVSRGLARKLLPFHDPEESGFVRMIYGGCLMARRCALDQVGWFDGRFFMYGEDVDLSWRIERANWRSYYLSSSAIVHEGGGATSRAPEEFATLMKCESKAKLMDKYFGCLGQVGYRGGVLVRAAIRLVVLSAYWVLMRKRRVDLGSPWRRQVAMIRWGLGVSRPRIPQKVS